MFEIGSYWPLALYFVVGAIAATIFGSICYSSTGQFNVEDALVCIAGFLLWPGFVVCALIVIPAMLIGEIINKHDYRPMTWLFCWPALLVEKFKERKRAQ